jgi:3-methyl-2-oxobutanoate hydroxymethyltransferase
VRTTIHKIQKMKRDGEPIPVITAYDYTSAQIADRAGIPMIHVGDTLGMVVLGHDTTLPVTLDEMIHHTRSVVRGTEQALVTADMPFLTYTTVEQAVASAGRLMQEAGAHAVKLEGGAPIVPMVRRLVELGIPVVGHLGYTPQAEHQIGRRVQGKQSDTARQMIEDALALEAAGAFSLVLELVPAELAREITARLRIPTIGIGAGPHCDGQVQVWHDLMGLYTDFVPRHARRYLTLADSIGDALRRYMSDVSKGVFPTMDNTSSMSEQELQEAVRALDGRA